MNKNQPTHSTDQEEVVSTSATSVATDTDLTSDSSTATPQVTPTTANSDLLAETYHKISNPYIFETYNCEKVINQADMGFDAFSANDAFAKQLAADKEFACAFDYEEIDDNGNAHLVHNQPDPHAAEIIEQEQVTGTIRIVKKFESIFVHEHAEHDQAPVNGSHPATISVNHVTTATTATADSSSKPAPNKKDSPNYVKQVKNPVSPMDYVTPYQQELVKRVPKTIWVILLLELVIMVPGLMTSSFSPAFEVISDQYGVSVNKVQALVSLYLAGFGIGQLFWGPVADRYGRKLVLILAGIMGIMANFYMTQTPDYHHLEISRLLQGFAIAGLGLIPTTVLKDLYSPRQFVIINSWLMIIFLFVPAASPIFGGIVILVLQWQWIFYIISMIIAIAAFFYIIFIPETLDPSKKQTINPIHIVRNYYRILIDPRSFVLILLNILYSTTLFLLPTLFPALLLTDYHISPTYIGYYSFLPILFSIVGNKINGTLVSKYQPQKIWFYASIVQTVFTAVNYIVAYYFLNVYGVLIAIGCNIFFNGFNIGNTVSLYLMKYGHMAGTANSLLTSLRFLVPAAVGLYYTTLPRAEGMTLLMAIAHLTWISFVLTLLFNYLWPADKAYVRKRAITKIRKQRLKEEALATSDNQ